MQITVAIETISEKFGIPSAVSRALLHRDSLTGRARGTGREQVSFQPLD
jgi:hypothetical protein